MDRSLRGASLGLAIGTLVGLGEAALYAEPAWGGAVWLVGALVDGAIGALAGGLWARRGGTTRVSPTIPLLATLAVDAGLAVNLTREPTIEPPADVRSEHPDILWIVLTGLHDAALDEGATPRLHQLAAEGVRYRRAWAPSTAPEVALASLLTGRTPGGHGVSPGGDLPEGVPTIAEAARLEGLATRAVLSADPSFARGFSEVVHPRPPRLAGLDPASAKILLVRALDLVLGPKGPAREVAPAGEAAAAALGWLAEDTHQLVLVHLTALPGAEAEVDAAVGEVLDALKAAGRLDRTLVAVSGAQGSPRAPAPTSDAAAELRPEALHVPLILRLPGGKHAGSTVRRQIGTHDVGPSLLGTLDHVEAPPWEGVPQLGRIPQLLALDAHAPEAALALSAPWPEPVVETQPPPPPPPPPTEPPLGTDGKPDTTPRKRTADPMGPGGVGEGWEPVPGAGGPPAPEKAGANVCDVMVPGFGDEAQLAVQTDAEGGWYYALRMKGYALHTWGSQRPSAADPWRLYDLKHDPQELGRPLAREALTCDGRPAAELAADLLQKIPPLLDAAAQVSGRTLSAKANAPRAGRASMPDPTRVE
jgi:hypothetical protein